MTRLRVHHAFIRTRVINVELYARHIDTGAFIHFMCDVA